MDEDIRSLLKKIRQGDRIAHDRLIRLLGEFIRNTCRAVAPRKGVEVDDAVQEALMLIPQAARDFDLRRKVEFTSFLRPRILGAITTSQRVNQRQRVTKSVWDADLRWLSDQEPKPKLNRQRVLKHAIAAYWPPKAVIFVRRLRRRNDRLIAKWLWLDAPSRPQAVIARRLGVSRSAVFQRKQTLTDRLFKKFGKLYMGEQLIGKLLNEFDVFAIEYGIDE